MKRIVRTLLGSTLMAAIGFTSGACRELTEGETARAARPEPAIGPAPERPLQGPLQPVRIAGRDLGAHAALEPIDSPSIETLRALRPTPEKVANLLRSRHHFADRPSTPALLTTGITGAHLDLQLGQRLTNVIAGFPEDRRAYGVAGLTEMQFWSLCEPLMFDSEVEHEGETYESRYRIDPLILHTAPVVSLYTLSSTCTGALLASAGRISQAVGAGCTREDEEAHFPAASACRSCLEVDGDHARCVREQSCREQMAREIQYGAGPDAEFYDVVETVSLACAPEFYDPAVLLVRELGPDNAMITPFDHQAIVYWCYSRWNVTDEKPELFCRSEAEGTKIAIADVMVVFASHIRRPGETEEYYRDRLGLVTKIELDHVTLEMMPVFPGALGDVSTPIGTPRGWGFNPNLLRPGGTDPRNPDHTQARDWIGAVGMKTATRHDGITVGVFNHNLCAPGDWIGPDASGRYFCRPLFDEQHTLPADGEWQHDRAVYALPDGSLETFPTLTLVSTGRMDTNVPGAHLPKIMGSPFLADPEWDNCAWPDMFVPDEMAVSDVPGGEPTTLTAQTYRFDREGKDEVRIGMSSNTRRDFCFQAPR